MALRDLVEGECGGANSLVRLTSHFVQDRGLKDEGLRHPFPCGDGFSNSDADQLVQQFLEETLGQSPQTFRMDSLLQEMREIGSAVTQHAPVQAPGVAAMARDDPACLAAEDSIWAEQYLESGKHFDDVPHGEDIWNAEVEKRGVLPGEEVFELGFGPKWAQEYLDANEQNLDEAEAWSKDAREKRELRNIAKDIVSTADDSKFAYSKFMKFMKQVGDGEILIKSGQVIEDAEVPDDTPEGEAELWVKDFVATARESTDEAAEMEVLPNVDQHLAEAEWVTDFEKEAGQDAAGDAALKVKEEGSFSSKFWNNLQDEWEKLSKSGDLGDHPWMSEFSEYYDPFKEYSFEPDNPMKDNTGALEEGKRKLEEGDLPSAVMCFESAVQQTPDSSEAWQLLGITQAENEQDPFAIAALKKCLNLDPKNLVALMALAVSYTNESYQNQACQALKDWLRENPKYSDLVPETDSSRSTSKMGVVSSLLTHDVHKEVQEMYLAAANRNPLSTLDADVQCGLGVLFNLTSEYDKAVDCFKSALQIKNTDSRMWNRLGATLANGNRSEEAVDAYHNALQLSPGFVRARYNLGITCVNLAAHREAAEHLLTALNQQASGRGMKGDKSWTAMSDSIWSTLRLVMSLLDRHDLYESLDNRDLDTLNKEFGIE